MISETEFENLLERPESAILDFKSLMYDFSQDSDLGATSKFVKDVISFCNTIRNETGYIIIGVEDNLHGNRILVGLDQNIDDSILQQKLKDKVFPRPTFHYYSIGFQNKRFGILEFPICKYPAPITPTIKLRGLEIGKVYYRHGTSNTEALGLETIKIYEWLKSLPDYAQTESINEEVNKLIGALAIGDKILSVIFADILTVAQKHKLLDLVKFCSIEIKGLENNDIKENEKEFDYRLQSVFISHQSVEVNPYYSVTSNQVKKEFEKNENFFQMKLLFTQSIINIEELKKNFEKKPDNTLGSFGMNYKEAFRDSKGSDFKVNAYFFIDTINSLYGNIRQAAIDKLMKIV